MQLVDPFLLRGRSKQRHVDVGFGGRAHAPSQQDYNAWGGGWSRGTVARQGDSTAFLAGVSVSRPAPSAEILETPPELRCSPPSEAFENRGNQGYEECLPSARDLQTMCPLRAWSRNSGVHPLWASALQNSQMTRRWLAMDVGQECSWGL